MLSLEENRKNNVVVIKASGKMLDTEALKLSEKVKELAGKGNHKIILDLNGITLLNSCYGLGIIAACWGCLNKVNGILKIAQPSDKVEQLLEITKLNQVIDVYSTVEQAVKSFH
jgi:anti-anti-sigma factor